MRAVVRFRWLGVAVVAALAGFCPSRAAAQDFPPVTVEGQPLAANVKRLLEALDFLGSPLPTDATKALKAAAQDQDAKKIQELLDQHALVIVSLSPEARVKAAR